MYIKTVNTDNKYKCIVMRSNDPSRVDGGGGGGGGGGKDIGSSIG